MAFDSDINFLTLYQYSKNKQVLCSQAETNAEIYKDRKCKCKALSLVLKIRTGKNHVQILAVFTSHMPNGMNPTFIVLCLSNRYCGGGEMSLVGMV